MLFGSSGLPNTNSNVKYLAYIIGIDACEIDKQISLQSKCEDIINFNVKLKKACEQNNIKYFDLITPLIKSTFFYGSNLYEFSAKQITNFLINSLEHDPYYLIEKMNHDSS